MVVTFGTQEMFSRRQLLPFSANLQVQLIGTEFFSGSHFLGFAVRAQVHDVHLMQRK